MHKSEFGIDIIHPYPYRSDRLSQNNSNFFFVSERSEGLIDDLLSK